jgi:molybdopterin converting factor small subunit
MGQQIEVECCGILQQVCGGRRRQVTVDALPATVAEVLAGLVRDVPAVAAYLGHTACAVGDRIVKRDARLQAGETLVLLPPVSGG